MGPCIATLMMQHPIIVCYRFWVHKRVGGQGVWIFAPVLYSVTDEGGIDPGIDDQVRHMNVLGAEFSRHALCQGA